MLPGSRVRQEAQKGERQADADGACGETDEERLGEQLADDTAASRPERDAYAQLAHSARCAGQQKIGGIAAGDQQHDGHRAEQQPQQRTHVANGAVNEVLHVSAPAAHAWVVKLVEARHDGAHLRLRLRDGDSGP